jgi:dinuclear metal center YbgI/SA1388 family protein
MKLKDVVSSLEELAPLRYAESWDNVGLLVGDPEADVKRALVTVDYTKDVTEEAIEQGAELVVAYHPPLFAAVKRAPHDALWTDAIRRGVALYSPHTALDVAKDGTNDFLADACGIREEGRRALRAHAAHDAHDAHVKLVTFVPPEVVDAVSAALFGAGAGRIGAYSQCSFRSAGTGTFFGGEGASPAVGSAGRLESVDELRLETLVPIGCIGAVVTALRGAHPYEEPAFDIVRLAPAPEGASVGLGRIGEIDRAPRRALVARLKQSLAVSHLLVAGPLDVDATRVAVAAGAGGELLADAVRGKADVFVTGELRHHDALSAARQGVTVIAALHSNSERAAVRAYAARIAARVPGIEVRASSRDADPFAVI